MPRHNFALFQASLKVLLLRGNFVLLLWSQKGEIDLPGGRVDRGEEQLPLEHIMKREIQEELGNKVRYKLQKPLFQFKIFGKRSKRYALNTVYAAQYLGGTIQLSQEHKSYKWVDRRTFQLHKNDIRDAEKFQAFAEYFRSVQQPRHTSYEVPDSRRKNQTKTPHPKALRKISQRRTGAV